MIARYVLSELFTVLIIPNEADNDMENRLIDNLNEQSNQDGFSISSTGDYSFIEYNG